MSTFVATNTVNNNEIDFLNFLKKLEDMEHDYKDYVFPKFNVFRSAKLVKQEIRHSNILAFLLSPNESHGLGDTLLKRLVNKASIESGHINKQDRLSMALASFDDARVYREVHYYGGSKNNSLDILVWSKSNKVVMVIENKLLSRERDGQLAGYRQRIEADDRFRGKDYKKLYVYLSIDDEPSEVEADWWISIQYDFIKDNLNEIFERKESSLGHDVCVYITHYLELITRDIMKEINQEFRDACEAIYLEHKEIFDCILVNRMAETNSVFTEFKKAHINIIQLGSYSNKFAFVSKKLKSLIENKGIKSSRNGWVGKEKPVAIVYNLTDKCLIKLSVRVGPMEDQAKRMKLIQSLNSKFEHNKKENISSEITIVWSKSEKVNDDDYETDEVLLLTAMNKLYQHLIDNKVLLKVTESIAEVWG